MITYDYERVPGAGGRLNESALSVFQTQLKRHVQHTLSLRTSYVFSAVAAVNQSLSRPTNRYTALFTRAKPKLSHVTITRYISSRDERERERERESARGGRHTNHGSCDARARARPTDGHTKNPLRTFLMLCTNTYRTLPSVTCFPTVSIRKSSIKNLKINLFLLLLLLFVFDSDDFAVGILSTAGRPP
jgi:hypothetical protein